MSFFATLLTWAKRSSPPRATVATAFAAGMVAALTSLALAVGAPYLLIVSAHGAARFSEDSVAALLVAIEIAAFLRSPSRFAERLSAHELGQRAVTRWRRWLTMAVGRWPYRRWAAASQGDLLERALGDTDTLQDLWLRALLPIGAAASALLVADAVAIGTAPSELAPGVTAAALVVGQLLVVASAVAAVVQLARQERVVRVARAARGAERVATLGAAPELALLGRARVVEDRLASRSHAVAIRERRRDHAAHLLAAITAVGPLFVVGLVALAMRVTRADTHAALLVVLVALGSVELFAVLRAAAPSLTAVAAAGERLGVLDTPERGGDHPFPADSSLLVAAVASRFDDVTVLDNVTLAISAGRRVALVGPPGAGKSTLLRLLARLDEPDDGTVAVGGVALASLDPVSLRAHLGYQSAEPGLVEGIADRVVRAGRVVVDEPTRWLTRLGLDYGSTDRLTHLSRGQAARVALARTLCVAPRVVLLDEPTVGLGDDERRLVLAVLGELEATIVIATHDPAVIAFCDEVVTLADGQVVSR